MHFEIDARGMVLTPELRDGVRAEAERILGRLGRRVSHVALTLTVEERSADQLLYVCDVRLRVPGVSDSRVQYRRARCDAAVAGALRRARQEVLRRVRRPLRALAFDARQLPVPA